MDAQAPAVFLRSFAAAGLPDPRRHNVRHRFTDILAIAILAVMCRADDWDEVVVYARANRAWLATFLALPNGIPSADTFARLFARLDPAAFERAFVEWTASLAAASDGRLIAIDGKAMRHSFAHGWDKQMVHLVSAWCERNDVVLGQLAVDEKGNEITAVPKLLAMLDVRGAVVSIDAMGCQREIAAQVVRQGGDYLLALKDNQPTLHARVRRLMDEVALDQARGVGGASSSSPSPPPSSFDYHEHAEAGHGRVETRRVWVTDDVACLGPAVLDEWAGLASLVMVERTRQDLGDAQGRVTTERHCYICSLRGCPAARAGRLVRGHWSVENRLHWRLDVCFGEDDSRLRKDHGAENMSRLRRIVLNKLRTDRSHKRLSLKNKRYRCSLDRQYLIEMLQQ
jgi:predicted transposase YbfD/YdcC